MLPGTPVPSHSQVNVSGFMSVAPPEAADIAASAQLRIVVSNAPSTSTGKGDMVFCLCSAAEILEAAALSSCSLLLSAWQAGYAYLHSSTTPAYHP